MRKVALHLIVAAALGAAALLAVSGSLSGPPRWSPDGLFYQARVDTLRGADAGTALTRTFQGPLGAHLRRVDPKRSGNPAWVRYNARFYQRRLTVPLAAAALEPRAGERAILDISLAGYVAAVLAIFGLLLVRFRLPVAAAVTLGTVFLPALTTHASYPLTDSWGVALETAALASGLLVLDRGARWLVPWTLAILVLSFTRDSTWILVLAALWLTVSQRSKVAASLLATSVAAAIPAVLAFSYPMRELLAQMLNDIQPVAHPTWSFVIGHWPGAVEQLLRADGGFVRDGAWYSAAYLLAGVLALFLFTRGARGSAGSTLLKAAAVAAIAYILVVPVFSAFRLELALVPVAAFGLASALERLLRRATVVQFAPSRRSRIAHSAQLSDLVSDRP
jgi:hypothetical protein